MHTVQYIKESNANFTYGNIYRVVDHWGDVWDYVIFDDNGARIKTMKHFFNDVFYMYQSDLYEMMQQSDDVIEIKTIHGTTITIQAKFPNYKGNAYLEIIEKENE